MTRTEVSTRTRPARRFLTKWILMAGLGLVAIFAGGCLTDGTASSSTGSIPIMLLDRNGGATHVVIYPDITEDLGGGNIRYTGSAFAQIEPEGIAGRGDRGNPGQRRRDR